MPDKKTSEAVSTTPSTTRAPGAGLPVTPSDNPAERVSGLASKAVQELRSALDTSQAVGTPIVLGDTTVIPLFSMGMGFGVGGGDGGASGNSERSQVGAGGGGGGVKPVAIIIAGPDGVRMEPIEDLNMMQRLAGLVDDKLKSRTDKKEE